MADFFLCRECVYWKSDTAAEKGRCRRYAPRAMPVPSPQQSAHHGAIMGELQRGMLPQGGSEIPPSVTVWPITRSDDGCAEGARRT